MDRSQIIALESVDIDALFAPHDDFLKPLQTSNMPPPGEWLQAACAYGRAEAALNAVQDQVAARLMTLQSPDGYLGRKDPKGHLSGKALDGYADNLSGLLAYYRITHNPAAIYVGMRAGDVAIAMTCDKTRPGVAYRLGSLRQALLELYQATGDAQYINAVKMASDTCTDGLALTMLYRATGKEAYLETAKSLWAKSQSAGKPPTSAFTAELLKLTGLPCYAAQLAKSPTVDPIPLKNVALTRAPGGIAANCSANLEGTFGSVRLTQRIDPEHQSTRLTIHVPKPMAFAVQLFVPNQPIPIQKSTLYGPPQVMVNNVPQHQIPRPGQYVKLTKTWKDGDTIALLPAKPTVTASVSVPAVRPGKLLDGVH